MFVRHFGKFCPGDFLYYKTKKRIGVIGEKGDLTYLHIQWLSGYDELISIHPVNAKQAKYLNRIKTCSKFSISDFSFLIPQEGGVLFGKIKKLSVDEDNGEVTGFSFALREDRKKVEDEFKEDILTKVKGSLNLDGNYSFSINTQRRGDLIEWLVKFQR